jgi:ribose 5-phosphate isomerase RpiB
MAKAIVDAWLETPFDEGERHLKRVKMIMDIEK